jgi:leader peptidase (prepilin peptidase)/N-methyltransferase
MMLVPVLLAFLAGLLIGSFLNVCIFRLPRDLSVASPARSFCPACEKTIAWYDNIPVVSYLLLGGRCRSCKERIPLRYPAVELATSAAFALCVAALGLTLPALKYSLYSAIMIMLIACDLEERILPDEFTLGGTLIGLALAPFVPLEHYFISIFIPYTWWPGWASLAESAFGAAVGSGAIWLVAFLYEKVRHREGMGLGDVKMIAMIGAFMGLPTALFTLIVASLLGSIIGIIFIRLTKQDAATYELPFGSFLGAAGLFLVLASKVLSVWFPRLAL